MTTSQCLGIEKLVSAFKNYRDKVVYNWMGSSLHCGQLTDETKWIAKKTLASVE